VTIGYVSQHAEELSGPGSLLDATQRATGLTPGKARALLGMFLFSGEEAEKSISGLSGGERRRFSLAVLVNSGANLLVLDEPTNHLDLESREALEDALRQFPGSLLLVSHDRALLDAVGTRTLAIEDGELRSYEGSWAEYVQARDARREAERAGAAADARAASPKAKAANAANAANAAKVAKPDRARKPRTRTQANGRPRPSKNAQKAQRALERELEEAEAALRALEDELADPAAWADPETSASSSERHATAKRRVEELYSRWEALVG
jgi:ATP-binding cassette subfamily F protein 3